MSLFYLTNLLHLNCKSVDEKHRGRGVGTALMAKLQATYSKLRLTVYQKNIRVAQLYKNLSSIC